jgi:tetratricopeptide (TPR) repeat protein
MRAAGLLLLAGCAATPPAPPPAAPPPRTAAVDVPRAPEARGWYDLALAHYNRGDFEKAKECARKAVQSDPEDLAARKLLDDIHSIIVGAPSKPDVREHLVRVEQAQIEITKHVADGRRYLGAKMYASALKEFETAELKIRAMPYDVEAVRSLLPEIRAGIAASRR